MYLEDKDYEISETLGISEVNAKWRWIELKGNWKNIKSLMNMKELDLLKKDWKKSTSFFWTNIKLELYKMIHKVIFDCEVDFDHKY
jgi:hypothetical protein